MLREGRRWAAERIARWVAKSPRREPLLIKAGRAADRRSYVLGTLYTHTIQRLAGRLRDRGNVYRNARIGPLDLVLDVTDHSYFHEYFYGAAHRYESTVVEYLIANLHEGDVFVDVGANVGFFSLIAARLVGTKGRVVAFEPHPGARALMVKLLQANGMTGRVDVEGAALAESSGAGFLHLAGDSVLSTLDPALSPADSSFTFDTAIDVPLTTLDEWLAGHADLEPRVAVIKIDVEGAEDRAIAGMAQSLQASPRARVVCETTPGSAADRRLRGLGFAGRFLDDHGSVGNYAYERE